MARLVKLDKVIHFDDPSKDKVIYANPEYVQFIEGDVMNIVTVAMQGTCLRVRGGLDEIAEKLSSNNNRRIY